MTCLFLVFLKSDVMSAIMCDYKCPLNLRAVTFKNWASKVSPQNCTTLRFPKGPPSGLRNPQVPRLLVTLVTAIVSGLAVLGI